MKFGLLSQIQGHQNRGPRPRSGRPDWDNNIDHAVAAEAAGFHYFWLTEQYFFRRDVIALHLK